MMPLLDQPPAPEPKHRRTHPDAKARAADPQPSLDAARHDTFGPAAVRVLTTLIEIERSNPHRVGGTASEIQMRMAYDNEIAPDRNSISRRLTSLHRKGYVAEVDERRDGGRGVKVLVFVATPEGRAWLAAA